MLLFQAQDIFLQINMSLGDKFSSCYVTLENGITYNGNVVWSDSDLDLSIVKIPTSGLNFVSLGNSDTVRVGETVYAIRKSYWFGISANSYLWNY